MMPRRRVFLLVLMVLTLGASLLTGCAGLDENATGEEIYNARCASCHRKDLRGGIGPPLGPESAAADQPREYYEVTIDTGIGRMPSFESSLSTEQKQRVIDYIFSVQAAG